MPFGRPMGIRQGSSLSVRQAKEWLRLVASLSTEPGRQGVAVLLPPWEAGTVQGDCRPGKLLHPCRPSRPISIEFSPESKESNLFNRDYQSIPDPRHLWERPPGKHGLYHPFSKFPRRSSLRREIRAYAPVRLPEIVSGPKFSVYGMFSPVHVLIRSQGAGAFAPLRVEGFHQNMIWDFVGKLDIDDPAAILAIRLALAPGMGWILTIPRARSPWLLNCLKRVLLTSEIRRD